MSAAGSCTVENKLQHQQLLTYLRVFFLFLLYLFYFHLLALKIALVSAKKQTNKIFR